jgi:hypothetical protein
MVERNYARAWTLTDLNDMHYAPAWSITMVPRRGNGSDMREKRSKDYGALVNSRRPAAAFDLLGGGIWWINE